MKKITAAVSALALLTMPNLVFAQAKMKDDKGMTQDDKMAKDKMAKEDKMKKDSMMKDDKMKK